MELLNIRVNDAEGLVGSDVPFLVYGDTSRGPTVSIIAGVHGCEYVAMRALRQFLDELDENQLEGCLRVVPMANLASFHARSPFVVPHDAKNLNRCFPGDHQGTFSDRLAAAIFDGVVRGGDFHIDMHSGDLVEDLIPFCIYDESPVEDTARAMARAYGFEYVVRVERGASPIAGTSSAAAAEISIPSITAEAGGRGLVDEHSVRRHLEGLRRTLSMLGLLSGPAAPAVEAKEVNSWTWLRAPIAGWWECDVEVGTIVSRGTEVGRVRSLEANVSEVVLAPVTGVPLFVTTSPAVAEQGLLLGFGALEVQ